MIYFCYKLLLFILSTKSSKKKQHSNKHFSVSICVKYTCFTFKFPMLMQSVPFCEKELGRLVRETTMHQSSSVYAAVVFKRKYTCGCLTVVISSFRARTWSRGGSRGWWWWCTHFFGYLPVSVRRSHQGKRTMHALHTHSTCVVQGK